MSREKKAIGEFRRSEVERGGREIEEASRRTRIQHQRPPGLFEERRKNETGLKQKKLNIYCLFESISIDFKAYFSLKKLEIKKHFHMNFYYFMHFRETFIDSYFHWNSRNPAKK